MTATPEQMLQLVIDKAPKLRAAGVSHVRLDGLEFTLGPDPVEATNSKTPEDDDDLNPLDDPQTFGRRRGAAPTPRRDRDHEPGGGGL